MIIATATERDLPELLELECLGFAEQERWSAAAWRGELVAEHRLVLVIREGTGVSAVACFGTLAETAELLRIVVHPSRARQGLARRLVAQGQEWAEACGAERMLLEVAACLRSGGGRRPLGLVSGHHRQAEGGSNPGSRSAGRP